MNLLTESILVAIVIAGFGAATWLWIAISSQAEELRNFRGFEGMHFDE